MTAIPCETTGAVRLTERRGSGRSPVGRLPVVIDAYGPRGELLAGAGRGWWVVASHDAAAGTEGSRVDRQSWAQGLDSARSASGALSGA